MSLTSPATSAVKAIYDVPAPAKLNLFLHITGRRSDGYHLLQSVFMLIDWCDTLHFETRRDGLISRHDATSAGTESGVLERLPDEDLTVRAAKALQKAAGITQGVHITLEKNIPAQAGMGGGSSDAASCLIALQRLWKVKIPRSQLLDIAVSLGADVPFFLAGSHAWVEGIGEQITPLKLPAADFLILKPPVGLPTQAIFNSKALKRDSETATLTGFAATTETRTFEFGRNDLQPVARELCKEVGQSIDWLSSHGLKGRMTGSGSAVFAHLPHGMKLPVADGLLTTDWKYRKCSNLEEHPLVGW